MNDDLKIAMDKLIANLDQLNAKTYQLGKATEDEALKVGQLVKQGDEMVARIGGLQDVVKAGVDATGQIAAKVTDLVGALTDGAKVGAERSAGLNAKLDDLKGVIVTGNTQVQSKQNVLENRLVALEDRLARAAAPISTENMTTGQKAWHYTKKALPLMAGAALGVAGTAAYEYLREDGISIEVGPAHNHIPMNLQ